MNIKEKYKRFKEYFWMASLPIIFLVLYPFVKLYHMLYKADREKVRKWLPKEAEFFDSIDEEYKTKKSKKD